MALPAGLHAQAGSPFALDQRFSADELTTTKNGVTLPSKIYVDDGRIRTEMGVHDVDMISIILPAAQKSYSVIPSLKIVMTSPYDPKKLRFPGAALFNTKFELVGPDTVDGIACNKYKGTAPHQTYFLWTDPAKNVPMKMTAGDGSLNLAWKNYHAGPQSAALFTIPAGYKVMPMPAPATTPYEPVGLGQ